MHGSAFLESDSPDTKIAADRAGYRLQHAVLVSALEMPLRMCSGPSMVKLTDDETTHPSCPTSRRWSRGNRPRHFRCGLWSDLFSRGFQTPQNSLFTGKKAVLVRADRLCRRAVTGPPRGSVRNQISVKYYRVLAINRFPLSLMNSTDVTKIPQIDKKPIRKWIHSGNFDCHSEFFLIVVP